MSLIRILLQFNIILINLLILATRTPGYQASVPLLLCCPSPRYFPSRILGSTFTYPPIPPALHTHIPHIFLSIHPSTLLLIHCHLTSKVMPKSPYPPPFTPSSNSSPFLSSPFPASRRANSLYSCTTYLLTHFCKPLLPLSSLPLTPCYPQLPSYIPTFHTCHAFISSLSLYPDPTSLQILLNQHLTCLSTSTHHLHLTPTSSIHPPPTLPSPSLTAGLAGRGGKEGVRVFWCTSEIHKFPGVKWSRLFLAELVEGGPRRPPGRTAASHTLSHLFSHTLLSIVSFVRSCR